MIEALHYEFMRNALLAAVLVSIACGMVGTFVVIKRIVFISGGITHAAFGGIGLGGEGNVVEGQFTRGLIVILLQLDFNIEVILDINRLIHAKLGPGLPVDRIQVVFEFGDGIE